MSRNRFELLFSLFHCVDNNAAPANDRLFKNKRILVFVNENFRMAVTSAESPCTDESIIPFLGRIYFR